MENYDIAIIGCGFIGSSLAEFLSKNFSVRTFDITHQPKWLNKYGVSHRICDIREYDKLVEIVGNPKVVINAAIIQIPLINEKKKLGYEVNVLGTQNICRLVETNPDIKGMILTGSWHVFGEKDFYGVIDEGFGYRPDKVDDRARLYAISKLLQEGIVRFYDERCEDKIFGVVRFGTVLGERMPEKTAANIFITNALVGKDITPYKHSMYRPMLYVAVEDVCKGIGSFVSKIINNEVEEMENSFNHIINLAYPEPITISDLAKIIKISIEKLSNGKTVPNIRIVDKGLPSLYNIEDKNLLKFDITKANKFLGIKEMISPKEAIDNIIKKRSSKAMGDKEGKKK